MFKYIFIAIVKVASSFCLSPGGFGVCELWSDRRLFPVTEGDGHQCYWEDCYRQIWENI